MGDNNDNKTTISSSNNGGTTVVKETTTTTTTTTIENQICSIRERIEKLKVQKESYELEGTAIILELTSPPDGILSTDNDMDDKEEEDDDDNDKNNEDDYYGNNDINKNDNKKKKGSTDVIKKQPLPAGIDTPLVDDEGYPRSDIDLYRVRMLRGRLQVLRTDHIIIKKEIEQLLYQLSKLVSLQQSNVKVVQQEDDEEKKARLALKPKPMFDPITKKWIVTNWDGTVFGGTFDSYDYNNPNNETKNNNNIQNQTKSASTTTTPAMDTSSDTTSSTDISTNVTHPKPFAIVNTVDINSPASQSGLVVGDEIIQFGTVVDKTNFTTLSDIVLTAASTNSTVTVIVLRKQQQQQQQEYTITLRPSLWSGRGVLGCHIVPLP